MLKTLCIGVAVLMGFLALANGVFMLVSPDAWYFAVPGVTDTGPFNQHFIRDIGLIFLFVGTAYLVGVAEPALPRDLLGRAHPVAGRPCPVPLLGGRRRHLRAVGADPRLSGRHAPGRSRRAPDPLGGPRRPLDQPCPQGKLQMTPRLNIFHAAPEGAKAMLAVEAAIGKSGLDHGDRSVLF